VWTSAHGEPFFVCLIRNEFAMVNMIHQNVSFTAWPNEQFNIYLDPAFTMTGRFPCNV
jgi:hypothetical protein